MSPHLERNNITPQMALRKSMAVTVRDFLRTFPSKNEARIWIDSLIRMVANDGQEFEGSWLPQALAEAIEGDIRNGYGDKYIS